MQKLLNGFKLPKCAWASVLIVDGQRCGKTVPVSQCRKSKVQKLYNDFQMSVGLLRFDRSEEYNDINCPSFCPDSFIIFHWWGCSLPGCDVTRDVTSLNHVIWISLRLRVQSQTASQIYFCQDDNCQTHWMTVVVKGHSVLTSFNIAEIVEKVDGCCQWQNNWVWIVFQGNCFCIPIGLNTNRNYLYITEKVFAIARQS